MSRWALRLTRDRLAPGARLSLPPLNRVIYALEGRATVQAGDQPAGLGPNEARHESRACLVGAGAAGATLLRYELVRSGERPPAAGVLLEHPIGLDPAAAYLMRCDRVDFDLGGEALPHRHKGGGIRCLVSGALELRVEGVPERTIEPGEAWFESGREPVYARASASEPTAFIRCSILPREIRGQSSIMYVDPRHAGSKPRRYTVLVDEPIELA